MWGTLRMACQYTAFSHGKKLLPRQQGIHLVHRPPGDALVNAPGEVAGFGVLRAFFLFAQDCENIVFRRGRHGELLAADGAYARMWRLQQQEEAGGGTVVG